MHIMMTLQTSVVKQIEKTLEQILEDAITFFNDEKQSS